MKKRSHYNFLISTTIIVGLVAGDVAASTLSVSSAATTLLFDFHSSLLLATVNKPKPGVPNAKKTNDVTKRNVDGLLAKIKKMRREADRLLMDVRDVSSARREYKRALEAIDRNDPYYNIDIQEITVSLAMCDAADGVVFVGNFSGKQVTVDVESVAADKTRILLSDGAEIVGCSFRLAPWGFAFLEDMKK